jgi:hypothetical protein
LHPNVLDENQWFVLPCPPRGKRGCEKLHVTIVALSQEEDDVYAGGEEDICNMIEGHCHEK